MSFLQFFQFQFELKHWCNAPQLDLINQYVHIIHDNGGLSSHKTVVYFSFLFALITKLTAISLRYSTYCQINETQISQRSIKKLITK
jgi:hypothetical protein